MRVSRVRQFMVAVALSAALAPVALAVPKYYEVSGGAISGNFNDPGLVINTSWAPGLSGTSFTLDNGNSSTFNFFSIWTNETTVNADDLVSKAISVTLQFSDPMTGATVNGVTFGGSILFGIAQWGQIQWNGPTTITLGDRVFSVALSDEMFNVGLFGLSEGPGCGATVRATITQISSAMGVPDQGNTAMLLGVALAGLVFSSRKRLT